jgi:EAL and modified HD-GYP domain-containing signal transduction protein
VSEVGIDVSGLAGVSGIDVPDLQLSGSGVADLVARCRSYDVRLTARGVGDAETLRYCAAAGFERFQGVHLPSRAADGILALSPSQSVALELVGRLSDPQVRVEEIEAVVRHSPELAVRLLRSCHAASAGARHVGSLHDAIMMVGMARLRSWVLLMSLATTPGAENALIEALTRAATCERLAATRGDASPEAAFTVGLLDGVAEALGGTAADLLDQLPGLADELTGALRGTPGPLREVLDTVIGYQRGRQPGDPDLPADPGLLVDAYLGALAWTTHTVTAAGPSA